MKPFGLSAVMAAGLALLGCTQSSAPVFRDPTAQIGATLRYDPALFAGDWVVRAGMPTITPLRALHVGAPANGSFAWDETRLVADGDVVEPRLVSGSARQIAPGRIAVSSGAGGPREIWVLWVDEGFRTAVLGAPSGGFGLILDRDPTGGADRITAAREILEFNGYDLSKLVSVEQ